MCSPFAKAATPEALVEAPELASYFSAVNDKGTIVLYDEARNVTTVYNRERAQRRFLPASTFKLPNSLISLESKTIGGVDVVVPWDGKRREREAWNRSQSMRTALPVSAIWFYQEMARRVGYDRMQRLVHEIRYGNADIGGPEAVDRFWLDGPLAISAFEQVAFLRRLGQGTLPVSSQTIEQVKEIMIVDETPGCTLRAKTGWGTPPGQPQIGWWVGWAENGDKRIFFAINIEITTALDPLYRQKTVRAILAERGFPACTHAK